MRFSKAEKYEELRRDRVDVKWLKLHLLRPSSERTLMTILNRLDPSL